MSTSKIVTLRNANAELATDPFGGAITRFVIGNNINPLSFSFSPGQMPENNRGGAVYQGHFACIGRWGEPSASEIQEGLPNHGEPANILWQVNEAKEKYLNMEVQAKREGLHVERICRLDEEAAAFLMKEKVTNIQGNNRPFNMVQHPTLAAPFLDEHTNIDCNGAEGFNQADYKNVLENSLFWNEGKMTALRRQQMHQDAVFSFIVNKKDRFGWITAWSATYNLLLGYIWKRTDYPWIHHWQNFNHGMIQYRGIEFGTAGIHQPFDEIANTATSLFGEKTFVMLDRDATLQKSYLGFMLPIENITGIRKVIIKSEAIIVYSNEDAMFTIKLSNQLANGLFE